MDGKVVRNTIAPGGGPSSEIKLFSALLHDAAIVIAQLQIPDGTNEITQVPALLADTDLTGMVVTGDAAHAQHATAAHLALDRGTDYLLTVKANMPGLLEQINAALPPAAPGTEHHVEIDHSKGRIVPRAIWVAPADGINFPLPRKCSGSAATPSTTQATGYQMRSYTGRPVCNPPAPTRPSSPRWSADTGP